MSKWPSEVREGLLFMEGVHISLSAERLGELFGVPITNTLLMSLVVSGLLIALALVVGRSLKFVPGRLQVFF